MCVWRLVGHIGYEAVRHTPFFPLAGKMSAALTDGGGSTHATVEFVAPPPSVAAGDIFPARGKTGDRGNPTPLQPDHISAIRPLLAFHQP
jgi:hypothetical protein